MEAAAGGGLSVEARRVAKRFAHFRTEQNGGFFDGLATHFSRFGDYPVLGLHFEYAVTTNERGRAVAERVSRHVDLGRRHGILRRRARMLDVGCAYGGFLVAFAERGFRVTGIEVNERFFELAMINLRAHGVDADLIKGDATSPHPGFSKRFDLITANDVVEHVPRLDGFLANLRDWLAPGAAAYLEIPNGAYPPFVQKDGHHELFGLTLLDFERGSEYLRALYPGGVYDTYHYFDLQGYRRAFEASGLSLTVIPETLAHVSLEGLEGQIDQLRASAAAGLETVPESLRPLVQQRLEEYLGRVDAVPRATDGERQRFLLDYGPGFWMVLARTKS